jgi:hypothetical protein
MVVGFGRDASAALLSSKPATAMPPGTFTPRTFGTRSSPAAPAVQRTVDVALPYADHAVDHAAEERVGEHVAAGPRHGLLDGRP